ncbi:MAG: TGS domain-containing protein [Polyangiaceae bacterium]|nr:TGS domain-containing protein [Polyangiaceae bacterium]
MPANLTQPYLEAEQRYRAATTTEEKIACLEEMIPLLPKHKGTEKLHADLKSRLAKLRKQGDKKGGPARRGSDISIEKEGAGQVLLLGAPNAGKSALMAATTNAPVEVTDFPFATHKPIPGSLRYEDVRIQLVDMPSISPDFVDAHLPILARMADAALLCVDLASADCLEQPEWVLHALEESRIRLVQTTVSTTPKVGPGKQLPSLVIGTKADHPDAPAALELISESLQGWPVLPVSVRDDASLDKLRRACFELFGIVRVYSKAPGKEPDRSAPFLLPSGATLVDFADKVHRDFRDRLAFARVWGNGKYDAQRAARDYVLIDQDVIELHMK